MDYFLSNFVFVVTMTLSLLTLNTRGCSSSTRNAAFQIYILKDFKITQILFSFKKPTTSAKIALVGNCGLTLHTVPLAPPGALESQPSLKTQRSMFLTLKLFLKVTIYTVDRNKRFLSCTHMATYMRKAL